MTGLLTPGLSDDGERISASAYGRLQDPPIGPPAMTRLFGKGLPSYPGRDEHGRKCRMVNPREADLWRAANCAARMGADGKVRGMPPPGGSSGRAPRPNPPGRKAAPGTGAKAPPAPPRPKREATPDDVAEAYSRQERLVEARTQAAEDDAATRRMRRLEAEGKYLDRDAALDVIAEFAGEVVKTINRTPADSATDVAGACGSSEHVAYQALLGVAERQRGDLERHAQAALDALRALGRRRGVADDPGAAEGEAAPDPA